MRNTEKNQQGLSFPEAAGSTGLWHLPDLREVQVQLHALPNLEERLEPVFQHAGCMTLLSDCSEHFSVPHRIFLRPLHRPSFSLNIFARYMQGMHVLTLYLIRKRLKRIKSSENSELLGNTSSQADYFCTHFLNCNFYR